jgi:hypothetical protein
MQQMRKEVREALPNGREGRRALSGLRRKDFAAVLDVCIAHSRGIIFRQQLLGMCKRKLFELHYLQSLAVREACKWK